MMGGVRLTRPFFVSAIAIVIGVLFLLANLPALATAIVSLGGGGDDSSQELARLVSQHDRALEDYKDRFDGRSVFHKPPRRRPLPKPRPIVLDEPEEAPPPLTPRVSPTYLGPSVIGIMGDEAWFLPVRAGEGPLRVRLGDTKEGVTLLEIDAPWSIKVGHKGGEYVIDVFERAPDSLFKPSNGNPIASLPSLQDAADAEETATLGEAEGARAIGTVEEDLDQPGPDEDNEQDAEIPAGDDGEVEDEGRRGGADR